MKIAKYLGWLLAVVSINAVALPQNFSYGPYITGVEDQLRQGPCDSFAAVGGVEAFYNLSYSGPPANNKIDLSEREAYSCGGNPARGLGEALEYIRDHGVIARSCFEMPNEPCDSQHADQGIYRVVYDDSRNCSAAQKSCNRNYRIKATSAEITGQMTSTNNIKESLLEYGPIMLHFYSSGVRPTDHAYLLYGWETYSGTTTWLLRDSWPCDAGTTESNVNLAAVFNDNDPINKAYVITSVTREHWNGSSWVAQSKAIKPYQLEQGKQSAVIQPPSNACMNRGQYTVTGLPAGSSVTGWSLRDSYPGYPQISSNGVVSGHGTDVTVVATVQHANGLKENITLPVGDVGVAHRVEKTADWCPSSSQREITLKLRNNEMAGYSYHYSMDVEPSGDGSYYFFNYPRTTYLVSGKTQAINYSTTVEAVKNGDPTCSVGQTVNRYVVSMPCSYY